MYGDVDPLECMGEVEKGLAKLRWSRSSKDGEAEERPEYFDHTSKTFDYGNMRACDQPFNKRIRLPRPLPDDEEVDVQVLRNKRKGITEEYISGSQRDGLCNLRG